MYPLSTFRIPWETALAAPLGHAPQEFCFSILFCSILFLNFFYFMAIILQQFYSIFTNWVYLLFISIPPWHRALFSSQTPNWRLYTNYSLQNKIWLSLNIRRRKLMTFLLFSSTTQTSQGVMESNFVAETIWSMEIKWHYYKLSLEILTLSDVLWCHVGFTAHSEL